MALTSRSTAAQVSVQPRESLARGRWSMAAMVLALLGFAGLWVWVRQRQSSALDAAVAMKIQAVSSPPLAQTMTAVSWPGFPPQSRILPPLFIATLSVSGFPLEALFLVGAWGTAAIATVLKATMRRERPLPPQVRVVAAQLGGSSFPSGHVLTYVGLYGFLAFLSDALVRPPLLRAPLVALFGGLVALIGPSRIYQGHHWPTDVVASYLLGTAYLLGLTTLYRAVKGRHAQVGP
jgi:membrane-associated phospholipid phosphatase